VRVEDVLPQSPGIPVAHMIDPTLDTGIQFGKEICPLRAGVAAGRHHHHPARADQDPPAKRWVREGTYRCRISEKNYLVYRA
jgi:hypothetical protein